MDVNENLSHKKKQSDYIHDCDCLEPGQLSVRRYINHRNESMSPENRTRGIARVKSYRQRQEEWQMNNKQDILVRSDLAELDGISELGLNLNMKESRSSLPEFAGLKMAEEYLRRHGKGTPGNYQPIFVEPTTSSQLLPTFSTDEPILSTSFSHNRDFVDHSSELPDVPQFEQKTCHNCTNLQTNIAELKERNIHLTEQNNASLKIIQAINDNKVKEIESAIVEQNALLQRHNQILTTIQSNRNISTITEIKSYIETLSNYQKLRISEYQEMQRNIQQRSEDCQKELEDELRNKDNQLTTNLIKYNGKVAELQQKIKVLEINIEELQNKNTELRQKQSSFHPQLLDPFADHSILQTKWSLIPEQTLEKLDGYNKIKDTLKNEDEIESPEQITQCLWYRYTACKNMLTKMQSLVETLGINAIDDTSQVLTAIDKKDEEITRLKIDISAKEKSFEKVSSDFNSEIESIKILQQKSKATSSSTEERQFEVTGNLQANNDSTSQEQIKLMLQCMETMSTERDKEVELLNKVEDYINELRYRKTTDDTSTKLENNDIQLKELEHSLQVYKSKVMSLHEENAELKKEIQFMNDNKSLQTERDSLLTNFDNIDRKWSEEKKRNESVTYELEKTKQELHHLREIEIKYNTLLEDRNELKSTVSNFNNQMKTVYDMHQEKITEKENEIHALTTDKEKLLKQLDLLKTKHENEYEFNLQQIKCNSEEETKVMRKELDLLQRRARAFEQEKEHLLEQVKLMALETKQKENVVRDIHEKCTEAIDTLKYNEHSTSSNKDLSLKKAQEILEDLTRMLKNKNMEFTELEQTIADLERDTLSRFTVQYDKNSLLTDDLANMKLSHVTLQSEIRTLRDQNRQLKQMVDSNKDTNAELRSKIKKVNCQSTNETAELRQKISAQNDQLTERTKQLESMEEANRNLIQSKSMLELEVNKLSNTKLEYDKLKDAHNDLKIKYELEKMSREKSNLENTDLHEKLEIALAVQQNNDDTMRQLQFKCTELLRDNEELEKITSIGDDKASTLINVVEKLKNKIDALAAAKKSLAQEKLSLQKKLKLTEEQFADSQKKSQTQITQLRNMLDQSKKDLKSKSSSLNKCEVVKEELEKQLQELTLNLNRITERLQQETELNKAINEKIIVLENKLKDVQQKLETFEEAENKQPRKEIIEKLKETEVALSTQQNKFKEKESDWKNKEKQYVDKQRQKMVELDSLLNQERSQHSFTKSKYVSVADELDFVKSQLASYKKRELVASTTTRHKSHDDEVNDLIMKSQNKAHHVLLSNPELVRSFTPDGRLLASPAFSERISPTSSYTRLD